MQIDGRLDGAGLAARVVALGRQGLSRTEIGPALDMEMAELAAREAADAAFARALRRAEEAERAWWEAQPREALAAGARLDTGAWREAMRWRWGGGAGEAEAADAAGAATGAAVEPAAAARPTVRYYIPDNLRERRLPDGTPVTPQMRRAGAIAQVQGVLDQVDRQLARWQAERARWEKEMRWVEARNYDPDAEDDEDGAEDEGWDDDEDDVGRDDEGRDDEGRDDQDGDDQDGDDQDGDDQDGDEDADCHDGAEIEDDDGRADERDGGGGRDDADARGDGGGGPLPLGALRRVASPTCSGGGDRGQEGGDRYLW